MSSKKTKNFALHAWAPEDKFLREEFNENFSKLDAAARAVTGSYAGTYDGADGSTFAQTITLGFQPKAVVVVNAAGKASGFAAALAGEGAAAESAGVPILTITAAGFTVNSRAAEINHRNRRYNYLALR